MRKKAIRGVRGIGASIILGGVIYLPYGTEWIRGTLGVFAYGWLNSMVYYYMEDKEDCDGS